MTVPPIQSHEPTLQHYMLRATLKCAFEIKWLSKVYMAAVNQLDSPPPPAPQLTHIQPINQIEGKPVAILTCDGLESYKEDDRRMAQILARALSAPVEHVVWNRPDIDWKRFQAVIIRSTWDYPRGQNLDRFLKVLESIDALGVQLLNPLKTIRWDCKKEYLKELSRKFPCIDSIWLSRTELSDLGQHVQEKGWTECVIKPVVSAGGLHTYRFRSNDVGQIVEKCTQAEISEWVLQPFVPEIVEEGEWSFILLDEKCVHTVLSKPAPGNFLVQIIHGGTHTAMDPPSWMIQHAEKIVAECGQEMTIARVDLVRHKDQLRIMEIEAIEPYLFVDGSERLQQLLAHTLFDKLCKVRIETRTESCD